MQCWQRISSVAIQVAKHLHHQYGRGSAVNAVTKQLALPAKKKPVFRLVTKVSCSALSQRSCQTPASSATQQRQLRCSALHLQPPQRWYLIKRCLVHSAAASPMTDLLHPYLPSQLLLPTCATDKLYLHFFPLRGFVDLWLCGSAAVGLVERARSASRETPPQPGCSTIRLILCLQAQYMCI